MRSITSVFAVACLVVTVALLVACGPSQEEQLVQVQTEALAELDAGKQALDAKRQELADARAALAAVDDEAEDAEDQRAELDAAAGKLEGEVIGMSDDFATAIVDFINSDPPVEGEPLSETQQAVIRMKSSEDMVIAQEHIDKGGDYRRAMDIYNQALLVDPENSDLQAALTRAEELRFMTQDRFTQVEKGMTDHEVRAMLGSPNLRNVREYPDRNVTAWFYPTTEAGDASAVWFRPNKAGDNVVYQTKFEAIVKEAGEGT